MSTSIEESRKNACSVAESHSTRLRFPLLFFNCVLVMALKVQENKKSRTFKVRQLLAKRTTPPAYTVRLLPLQTYSVVKVHYLIYRNINGEKSQADLAWYTELKTIMSVTLT